LATLIGRSAPPGSTIGVVTPGSPAETRAEVEDSRTLTIDEPALLSD
jgi:hypothetical protein